MFSESYGFCHRLLLRKEICIFDGLFLKFINKDEEIRKVWRF